VLDSPSGQATTEFAMPFSDMELENFLLKIGRPTSGVRRIESPENAAAREFGSRLYDAVFGHDVGIQWVRSIDSAEREDRGLRLRLRLSEAPQLSDLPWEYLYSPANDDFVVLSSWTPVVRYISLDKGAPPLTVAPPLKMLAMVSSPTDYPQLDVEAEWARLDEGLGDLMERGVVEIHRLERATLRELQRALRRDEFHLFHFIGHGGYDEAADDGLLLLETEQGRARQVSGRALGTILDDARTIRVAVLNACEGARASGTDPFAGVAQSLVARGIPAVVAMQFEITDQAAIIFAHEFYTAITDGLAVEGAVGEARRAIFGSKSDVEWGTAVLYMRAEDGRLFDLAAPPEPTLEMERDTLVMEPAGTEAVPTDVPTVEDQLVEDQLVEDQLTEEPLEEELPPVEDIALPDVQPEQELEEAVRWATPLEEDVATKPEDTSPVASKRSLVPRIVGGIAAAVVGLAFLSGVLDGFQDNGGDTDTSAPPATEAGLSIIDGAEVSMVPVPGVTIDGQLGDWDTLPEAYRLGHPVRDELVANRLGSDSEATLWVAFDDTSMYVAVEVDDDVYSQLGDGNQIWRGDALDINLFVGPSGDVPDRPDSRTLQLTMTPRSASGGPAAVLFVGNGQQFADNTTNLPIDLRGEIDADGDWRLEARIPWDTLGLDGPPNGLGAALFAVFDNDGETSNGSPLQAEILTNLEGVFFQQPPTWGTLTRG